MKFRVASLVIAVLALTACVYRIDIQQGNLLDDEDITQVQVGMTRSQVQFLLGTPMVSDSFHRDRWDYAYYLRRGRSPDVAQRWVVVHFENDRVARVVSARESAMVYHVSIVDGALVERPMEPERID